jgi:hypothetical protein
VVVLGSIGHEQEQRGLRKALDEDVEEGQGLIIEPVKVLDEQQHRSDHGKSEKEPLQRLKRAASPEVGIHLRQRRGRVGEAEELHIARKGQPLAIPAK